MLSRHFPALGGLLRQRFIDPLFLSSLYVLGGTVASALFGFLFWLLAARLTGAAEVGLTTAVIASATLLVGLFDLGLTPALIHYAAAAKRPLRLVNAAIRAGWLLSSVAAIGFLLGLPLWSPELLLLQKSKGLAAIFIAFTVANHLLGLQDVAMLALERPQHLFWRNVACNAPPLLLLYPLLQLFAPLPGLILAYLLPNVAVALFTSLWTLPKALPGYNFCGRHDGQIVSQVRAYGLTNHAGNLLWALPIYLLPILTVNLVTAAAAGHFAIAWTVVNGLLIIPRAITTSLYVEGSRNRAGLRAQVLRALGLMMALGLPLLLLLWLWGSYGLALFGRDFVRMELLRLLLLSFVPFALNSLFFIVLRVREQLLLVVLYAALLAGGVVAAVLLLGRQWGVQGIAAGWLVGNLLPLLFALLWLWGPVWQRRRKWMFPTRQLGLLLIIVVGLLFVPQPAAAQTTTAVTCTETAVSQAAVYALLCDFEQDGTEGDTLWIYDRRAGINGRLSWQDARLQRDALWVFDTGSDGTAELIIDFYPQGTALAAAIYPAAGAHVNTLLQNGFTLQNLPFATVVVTAPDGWWQRQGQANFNLDIAVDGLVNAAFDVVGRLDGLLVTDGTVDFAIQIRDENGNGLPESDLRTLQLPQPLPAAVISLAQSYLMVNVHDDEPPLQAVLPWPYLGGHSFGYLMNTVHSVTPPPIQIDWQTGALTAVGEFVASRGNDEQYFVYSTRPITGDEPVTPNFESPFGWYDLAADSDGQAELALRFVYYPAADQDFLGGRSEEPFNLVRYTWDQDNDGFWNYKVGLLGRYEVTDTVTAAGAEMALLPYESAPDWIMDKEWGPMTFVAAETPILGEGIYEWDFPSWFNEGYFMGWLDTPQPPRSDDFNFDTVRQSFRGEYRFDQPPGRVQLYVSAIDQQLHLRGAEGGLWNVDGQAQLSYDDQDGDGVFDAWVYQETPTAALQRLNWTPTHLLYAGANELIVAETAVSPLLFATSPPTHHDAWQALGAQLAPLQPLDPAQLRRLPLQAEGAIGLIAGATYQDLRILDGGNYRFVLQLAPDYVVDGMDALGIAGLAPGQYIVTFNGRFQIAPITASNISVAVRIPQDVAVTQLAPTPLLVQLHNSGSVDSVGLRLRGEAVQGAQRLSLADEPVQLDATETVVRSFNWQAPTAGAWEIRYWLEDEAGQLVTDGRYQATVAAANGRDTLQSLTHSGRALWSLPVLGAVAGLVAFCGLLLAWRSRREGRYAA